MDRLRDAIFGLFTRSYSVDEPFTDDRTDGEAELKAKDVVKLIQQQQLHEQQQQQQQRQRQRQKKKIFSDNERKSQYDIDNHTESSLYRLDDKNPTPVSYEMEFVDFINRNAPHGFSHKLHNMLPFIGASFITWPTYWIWRGYHWQTRRRTERIGIYIQRTFQHAKLMQVAILGIGLLMAASARGASEPLEMHEVSYKKKKI